MRNSAAMEKLKRVYRITWVSALIFFVMTLPPRHFFQVVAVTEVRPASVLNPLLGLFYGPPGVLGCALGNLAADVLSGYGSDMCLLGFGVQIIYGILPWLLWKRKGWRVRLNTAASVLRYMVVMLIDSGLTALLLGGAMAITGIGRILSLTTLMLFLNNFVFCMILGIPMILVYTYRGLEKRGENFSLNERFIIIFLGLAIVSAATIGYIAYTELAPRVSDPLNLWNRVYIYIAVYLFVVCIIVNFFLRYAEYHITIPIEKLAQIAGDYIHTGGEETLDTRTIVERCNRYAYIHSEVGNLAEALRDMALRLEHYIEYVTKAAANQERIRAELNVAAQIQADMLPAVFPKRKDFSIFASMHPAKEVGGDFYDFFMVDETHLAMAIADVSGKGIPAALFMVISRTLIKNQVLMNQGPGEVLANVNQQLCENNQAQMFVTVWLAILDLRSGELRAANAGHEYPALRRAGGQFELIKDKHGFVLAGMENMRYREYTWQLHAGDTLFVYTDGVQEATNAANALFGSERMLAALNTAETKEPAIILETVRQAVNTFVGEAEQFDDLTMLALTYHGSWQRELTVEARRENWEKVFQFIEAGLQALSCPLKTCIQLETAAEELFVNVASYAYPGGIGSITIRLTQLENPDRVQLCFIDQGIAYNPLQEQEPDTTLSAEERGIGGLGIHMVRKSMDAFTYQYLDGSNIVTIEKKINA